MFGGRGISIGRARFIQAMAKFERFTKKGNKTMATVTNRAISSHDEGPQPRKPVIEDQGPEQKASVKNPNRETAKDKDTLPEVANAEVTAFLEKAKTDPATSAALSQHKAEIPDKGNLQPSDSAANIPVSEVAAGIISAKDAAGPDVRNYQSGDPGTVAFGDPDSIAAWERRHAEEKKLRGELKGKDK